MDSKPRGWVYIVGALLAGWFAYKGNLQYSAYLLSLLFLVSGWHHSTAKHRK